MGGNGAMKPSIFAPLYSIAWVKMNHYVFSG